MHTAFVNVKRFFTFCLNISQADLNGKSNEFKVRAEFYAQ